MLARKAATRATFMPCSASGIAHPTNMSSISAGLSPGTCSIAAFITAAAISSGRVDDKAPRGALPTAVRTAETITADVIELIPQHLSFFQQVFHTSQGFRL